MKFHEVAGDHAGYFAKLLYRAWLDKAEFFADGGYPHSRIKSVTCELRYKWSFSADGRFLRWSAISLSVRNIFCRTWIMAEAHDLVYARN